MTAETLTDRQIADAADYLEEYGADLSEMSRREIDALIARAVAAGWQA